jgi:hypothetical protein
VVLIGWIIAPSANFTSLQRILPTLHESNVKRPTLDPAADDDRMDAFPLPKPTPSVLDLLLEAGFGRECKAWSWKLKRERFRTLLNIRPTT